MAGVEVPLTLDDEVEQHGRALLEGIALVADPSLRPGHAESAVAVRTSHIESDTNTWAVHRLGDDGTPLGPPLEGRAPTWSPDGRHLAFLRKAGAVEQLWVAPADGEPRPLTALPAGVLHAVWRPDGQGLVVVTPMVTGPPPSGPDPLVAWLRRPIVVDRSFYKLDGLGLSRDLVTALFAVGLDGAVQPLVVGPHQVQTVALSPSGARIGFTAAAHMPEGADTEFAVFVVDAAGGRVEQVTRAPFAAGALAWVDEERIIAAGQAGFAADRFAGLYEITVDSGRIRRLFAEVGDNVGGGPFGNGGAAPRPLDGRTVLFTVMRAGTFRLLRGDLETGQVDELAGDEHTSVSGYDAEAAVGRLAAVLATPTSAGELALAALPSRDAAPAARIVSAFQRLPQGAWVVPPEARVFVSPDGTRVHGWLHLPDGPGPHPLLLDAHGGPHGAWGPALDATVWYRHALVARGWAVLALNARGSDGYGEKFLQGLTGAWGEADEVDWFAALDALIAEGVADPARLAVTGYSYGGFLTNWLVGRTGRFRAAVAGGSICDLSSYAHTADIGGPFLRDELGAERHDRPELYRHLSPVERAAAIRTPLLLLHGERDLRCPLAQAEHMYGALRRLGRPVELVVYPEAGHALRRDGLPSHRLDYGARLVGWVERHAGSTDPSGGAR